jgi:hypothetical protein
MGEPSAAAPGAGRSADADRLVELDCLLFRAQRREPQHQRGLARREPRAARVQLLSYRRGIPIRARRIHDRRCQTVSAGIGYRRSGAPRGSRSAYGPRRSRYRSAPGCIENHPEWLLHNAAGELIHIGYVTDKNDPLVRAGRDQPRRPGYLRQTYRHFRDWGVRFIKMDFMDDTAVEGAYFRPNTTALEAQRIGLKIIRSAVGDERRARQGRQSRC